MKKLSFINRLGILYLASLALTALGSHPAAAGIADGYQQYANSMGEAGLLGLDGRSADNQTLGSVISNTVQSTNTIPGLLMGVSYLMGVFFGFWGIMKLKEHVENPQVSIWEPMKRFVAGGGFFALPTVMVSAMETLNRGEGEAADYSGFNTSGASELGLDGMMAKLIADIWMPMHYIIYGFCYLAGIILIIMGISRLLKSEQDGPRGPASIGTIMTFLVGGALLSIDRILGASMNSLFNTSVATSNGVLQYTAGMDEAALGHAHTVIAAIIGFVAILGWISFVRGLFILRGVSEGNNQASMMAAVTHILGGAIAVNLGGFIMAVQETLGITSYGIVFG